MKREILYNKEARTKLLSGVNKLAKAVVVTLGPRGRNVILSIDGGLPFLTKDGVTVARSIELDDDLELIGCRMVQNVAHNVNRDAGDGTTTATALANAILENGLHQINNGANPMELYKGIKIATKDIVAQLQNMAIPIKVKAKEKLIEIATISANGDREIGEIIADAIESVGEDGVISLDHKFEPGAHVELATGLRYEKGFVSPMFINNYKKDRCDHKNCKVLITDMDLSMFTNLEPILGQCVQHKYPLLIISSELDGDAFLALASNARSGTLKVVATGAPKTVHDSSIALLEDMAIVTGGTVVSEETGIRLEDVTIEDLGECEMVQVGREHTLLIGGYGSEEDVENRINYLKDRSEDMTGDAKDDMLNRVARIRGGIGVIYVGGDTEIDVKERKDRFEDALNSALAAKEEGYVAGGGAALVYAARKAEAPSTLTEDELIGWTIIMNACLTPMELIANNAGLDGDNIVGSLLYKMKDHMKSCSFGFNAATEVFEDMIENGIIDPVKVTRSALEEASSIAGLMLTTECIVSQTEGDK